MAGRISREPDNPPWHPVVDEFLKYPFLDALPKDRLKKAIVGLAGAGGGGGEDDMSAPFRVPIIYGMDADAGSDFVEHLNISMVSRC